MISKQIIHDYISRIENEISDNNNTSNENNGVQYCGMLYGIRIAEGKKQYPINDTGIEITDEFKKGLIKGLRRVLWCTQKKEQLVKKRYDAADEALIAYFFESECIPNCIERLKNKLHSANIDKGDTMRTKEEINNRIDEIRRDINANCGLDHTFDYGQLRGLKFVIECGCDDTRLDNDEALKMSFYEDVQPLNIIELRKQEVRDSYNKGIEDGLKMSEHNKKHENTKTEGDSVHAVNIKYELDKAAYKQFIADVKKIEAETKHESDLIEEYEKATMYKTASEASEEVWSKLKLDKDCVFFGAAHVPEQKTIPATIKDVCEWWIKEYPEDIYIDKTGDIGVVRDHMEYILEKQNGK